MKNKTIVAGYLSLILFSCLSSSLQAILFNTLADAERHARSLEEFPVPSNTDLLNPDYRLYHENKKPGYLSSFFSMVGKKLGILSPSFFDLDEFESLLKDVVKQRELASEYGDFVYFIKPNPADRFIIWGDISGSFHSLVRTLRELNKWGILDETFRIIDSKTYLVFNGDAIDLSPHNLETLGLLLRLLERNPDRVFYIKGGHENNEYWKNFDLDVEIEIRLSYLSKDLFSRFFNTLPLALYLQMSDDKELGLFRISYFGHDEERFEEKKFAGLFSLPPGEKIRLIKLTDTIPAVKPFDVQVLIRGQNGPANYQETDGLMLLSPDRGATTWNILSSPNYTYRKLFDFHNDSFVLVQTANDPKDWSIILYKQDIREMRGFRFVGFDPTTSNALNAQELERLAQEQQGSYFKSARN